MNKIFKDQDSLPSKINDHDNVLILTSPGNQKRGYIDSLGINSSKINFFVELIHGYPTLEKIISLTKKYKDKEIDLIVSLGGGSVIDTSKILSASLPNQNMINLQDHYEFTSFFGNKNISKVFHISIPTTSGSGAESTKFSTVWNFQDKTKISIENDKITPDEVYLLSNFLVTLNFDNTLYPGLDAICHCFDSLLNKKITEESVNLSLRSLQMFNKSFNNLLLNLKNEKLRSEIHIASNLAGKSINLTKTSITHALSYPLTINYGVPHGLACAVFLIPVHEIYKKKINNPIISKILSEILIIIENLNLNQYLKQFTSKIDSDLYTHENQNPRLRNFFVDVSNKEVLDILKKIEI